MGIGLGIFLLVVGAILSFGVRDNLSALDLTMVGYICMGAGRALDHPRAGDEPAAGQHLAHRGRRAPRDRRSSRGALSAAQYDEGPVSSGEPALCVHPAGVRKRATG